MNLKNLQRAKDILSDEIINEMSIQENETRIYRYACQAQNFLSMAIKEKEKLNLIDNSY